MDNYLAMCGYVKIHFELQKIDGILEPRIKTGGYLEVKEIVDA